MEATAPAEPVVEETEPRIDPFATALWAVRDAADEAAESWSLRLEAETRWRRAEAALRASVEALADPIRPDVLAAIEMLRTPPASSVDERVVDLTKPLPADRGPTRDEDESTNIPGDIPEPADDAPEVVTRRPGPDPTAKPAAAMAAFARSRAEAAGSWPEPKQEAGGGPGLPRGQRDVLEAVTRHDGDRRAAAAELKRTVSNIENQLEYIGKKGLLPAALIAKLPARYAKYQRPGV